MNKIRGTCTLLLALGLNPAFAADKTYGPGYLRPEEIIQCMRDRNEVVATNLHLSQEKARIEQESASINEAEARLVQLQAGVDRDRRALTAMRSAMKVPEEELDDGLKQVQDFKRARAAFTEKVKTYNDGVNAQQARREPHNSAVLSLNARLEQLELRKREVDARCTGRQSYKDDVQKAKEALAEEEALQR